MTASQRRYPLVSPANGRMTQMTAETKGGSGWNWEPPVAPLRHSAAVAPWYRPQCPKPWALLLPVQPSDHYNKNTPMRGSGTPPRGSRPGEFGCQSGLCADRHRTCGMASAVDGRAAAGRNDTGPHHWCSKSQASRVQSSYSDICIKPCFKMPLSSWRHDVTKQKSQEAEMHLALTSSFWLGIGPGAGFALGSLQYS